MSRHGDKALVLLPKTLHCTSQTIAHWVNISCQEMHLLHPRRFGIKEFVAPSPTVGTLAKPLLLFVCFLCSHSRAILHVGLNCLTFCADWLSGALRHLFLSSTDRHFVRGLLSEKCPLLSLSPKTCLLPKQPTDLRPAALSSLCEKNSEKDCELVHSLCCWTHEKNLKQEWLLAF